MSELSACRVEAASKSGQPKAACNNILAIRRMQQNRIFGVVAALLDVFQPILKLKVVENQ